MNDVDNLIGLLDRLVESGRTVFVIEHNLDIVARADWVIYLGPGAGHDGGRVIFEGPPAELCPREGLPDRRAPAPAVGGRGAGLSADPGRGARYVRQARPRGPAHAPE